MNLQPISLFILLLIATTFTFSQTTNDTIAAHQYYQKGDSLLIEKKYEESIKNFDKALSIYQKQNTLLQVIKCYNKLSENNRRKGNHEYSVKLAEKVLKICKRYFPENYKEKVEAYRNIINSYERRGKYEIAIKYSKEMLEFQLKTKKNNEVDIANTYEKISTLYGYLDKLDVALDYITKCLSIKTKYLREDHADLAMTNFRIGIIYGQKFWYNISLRYFEKALQILNSKTTKSNKDLVIMAAAYSNISGIYSELKMNDKALKNLKESEKLCYKSKESLKYVYTNMASVYSNYGMYQQALEYINKAMALHLQKYDKTHPDLIPYYINIGIYLKNMENYDKAIENYNSALKMSLSLYGENHVYSLTNLNNIGTLYREKKEFDKALQYFQKVLSYEKDKTYYSDLRLLSYQNLAILNVKTKQYDKARYYLKRGLEELSKDSGKNLHYYLELYNAFSKVCYEQKKYKQALAYADKALLLGYKRKNSTISELDYKANLFYNFNELLTTLLYKGKALQGLYKKYKDVRYLHQSIDLYRKTEALIQEVQKLRQHHQDKIAFAKDVKSIYSDAIKAQLSLYGDAQQPYNLQKAFYYAEKSRANVLKGLVAEHRAKSFSQIPDTLLTLEQSVKAYRAFYLSQITKEQLKRKVDSVTLTSYQDKLFDINRKQDSITQLLEKKYPKYYQLKYQNQIISVSEVKKQLDNNTDLLEFVTTDSITLVFGISKDSLFVKELSTPGLVDKVQHLQRAITSQNDPEYKKMAYSLYQDIIKPIKDHLTGDQLIIIPDGPLWHLNFDLLLTDNENVSLNEEELPYLLKEYAISYANSASLLFNPSEDIDQVSQVKKECLAFSFSDSTQVLETPVISLASLRDTNSDLPGTRKEIKAISEIIDGQYYYGSQAIEMNFKKNVDSYAILHLALHGEVDHKNPDNSKLYFSKNQDSTEDNLLYSHELFALNIPAELTVLSACNTGSGKIAEGEGIMSLGNAFQYAGTKSLLLSRWKVSDKTTPQLMQYFYTNLKSGMNKAKALQQAKLQYLNTSDPLYTHPFYWSSFYLIGNTTPMRFQEYSNTMYSNIVFLLISIIGIIIFFFVNLKSPFK